MKPFSRSDIKNFLLRRGPLESVGTAGSFKEPQNKLVSRLEEVIRTKNVNLTT